MVYLIVAVILAAFLVHELFQRAAARRADRPDPRKQTTEYRAAQEELDRAGTEYETRVSKARGELRDAYYPEQLGAITVQAIGDMSKETDFVLHETSIQTPSSRHDITADTRADVDTLAGILETARDAIERIGQGTLVRGPVADHLLRSSSGNGGPDDAGHHYLLLQGNDWIDSAVCAGSQQRAVQAFAEQVNLAASEVGGVRAQRAEHVAEVKVRIDEVTRDRGAVEQAEAVHARL